MNTLQTALREHGPEYAIEAAGIAVFMLAALGFTALLEHPHSPLHAALPDPLLRRALMGLAMAGTAIALVYSPWGARSGAHFNPALTLTFYRLGKIRRTDAIGYAVAQFGGALGGAALAAGAFGAWLSDPLVRFAVTIPGSEGRGAAFAAEAALAAGLMTTVLCTSNAPRYSRFTGVFVGGLIALYIALEAPLSGMSMNPARTLGSAAVAHVFDALWIYFAAPALGMLAAAEVYLRARGTSRVRCAKLHHAKGQRCIFNCQDRP